MAGTGGEGSAGDFASRLRDLRSRGSAVLVTGGETRSVHTDVCRRLLGDDPAVDRHRLLVLTDGRPALEERAPTADSGPPVLDVAATRSAVARPAEDDDRDVVTLGDVSLPELGVEMAERVEAVRRRHGPLEPTELRVCVDSLVPLLDAHGEPAVFRFLVILTRLLREYDALGHAHLPVEREAYVARLLGPLFDAVVEARVREGRLQQRWHLDDGDLRSRWLPV